MGFAGGVLEFAPKCSELLWKFPICFVMFWDSLSGICWMLLDELNLLDLIWVALEDFDMIWDPLKCSEVLRMELVESELLNQTWWIDYESIWMLWNVWHAPKCCGLLWAGLADWDLLNGTSWKGCKLILNTLECCITRWDASKCFAA